MIRTLFRTMLAASDVLGVDANLTAGWRDILENLHPYPTASVTLPSGRQATILADWQGAPPPPKNDRQMLSSIQPIYPGGQFYRSMPNRSAFQMAADAMEYLDYYSVQADTFCIMYTISGRVGANQTKVFPQMVKTNLQWGMGGQTFMENLMTLPQIGPAALVYVNELFVQSHEGFVRIYPAHFTDTGVMGGPPRGPAVPKEVTAAAEPAVCNLTGKWSMPDGHGMLVQADDGQLTGECCVTPTDPTDKEFTIVGNYSGQGGAQAQVPVVPGHPECGSTPAPPPTNIAMTWTTHKSGKVSSLSGIVSADCQSIHWLQGGAADYARGWKSEHAVAADESHSTESPPLATQRPWLGSTFSTLRTHGAFLVSGSLSETGEVGPVTVLSERGGNLTFLTPWPRSTAAPRVSSGGVAVPVAPFLPPASAVFLEAGERLYRFATRAGASYTIAAPGAGRPLATDDSVHSGRRATIYVDAARGHDSVPDHASGVGEDPLEPLRTLSAAQAAARRALLRDGVRGVTVRAAAGSYEPLILTAEDSGRSVGADVWYEGAPGASISGGVLLPASAIEPVPTSDPIRSRLPAAATTRRVSVKGLGIVPGPASTGVQLSCPGVGTLDIATWPSDGSWARTGTPVGSNGFVYPAAAPLPKTTTAGLWLAGYFTYVK